MLSASTRPLRFLGYAADFVRTRMFRQTGGFAFGEVRLPYFDNRFNWTWTNERCVEVSIGLYFLREFHGKRILEVGNVLGCYGRRGHTIVDKYERAEGVTNRDVLEMPQDVQYDLILSLSTLEHVGFDESKPEPDKPLRAVRRLSGILAPGGLLAVTLPIGYNPAVDACLERREFPFTSIRWMKRTTRANDWEEVSFDCVRGARYNHPYPGANALAVGLVQSPGDEPRVAGPSR